MKGVGQRDGEGRSPCRIPLPAMKNAPSFNPCGVLISLLTCYYRVAKLRIEKPVLQPNPANSLKVPVNLLGAPNLKKINEDLGEATRMRLKDVYTKSA